MVGFYRDSFLIAREDLLPLCTVQAMIEFCKLRGTHAGPLFCHGDTSPITVGQFNAELHSCLRFCGLDTNRYKGHSFPIGAVCHAADKGFSDAQICALGRWKSDASKRLSLKRGTGNQGMEMVNGERGTGNGESLTWGIFKMGNL